MMPTTSLFMDILASPRTHSRTPADEPNFGAGRYRCCYRRIVGRCGIDLFHACHGGPAHFQRLGAICGAFSSPEHAHEIRLFRCWPALTFLVLYLAARLNDIGSWRGGDHSDIGAQKCAAFANTS